MLPRRARLASLVTLAACALLPLVGCRDKTTHVLEADAAPAAPVEPSATASASAAPPAAGALVGDANGTLPLTWRLSGVANESVAVSLVAGGETLALGTLFGASDDPPGGVGSCAMKRTSSLRSTLECGGVPAYNFYTAALQEGALVVTLTTGVDMDPGSERVKVVLRRPTTATAIKASGPASRGLSGNCRPGYVQRTLESPCMRQCLKGNECKGAERCVFVSVKGLDGDHRVHACVAPGK
jgi:hypothetical protein